MRFLLPQGIGDSVWALHKIQSVAQKLGNGKIEVFLNCYNADPNGVESRALDFVRRFKFVDRAQMLPGIDIHPQASIRVSKEGHYIYIPDGPMKFNGDEYYALMPNGPLERGIRLEDWLPEFETNWGIMKEFHISDQEKEVAAALRLQFGEYAVFYLGPLAGNLQEGHNRGMLWKPEDWVALGKRIHSELGLSIVVVGAGYDEPYSQLLVYPLLGNDNEFWADLVGKTNVGELYGITTNSRFVISYQSGVGIVSNYLGVPTGIFWRPKGDSINPNIYLSFEEAMASAWANPEMIRTEKHMPLIYGRHDPDYILTEIKRRNW